MKLDLALLWLAGGFLVGAILDDAPFTIVLLFALVTFIVGLLAVATQQSRLT